MAKPNLGPFLTTRAQPALPKFQQTALQLTVNEAVDRLLRWAVNPWRRLSMLLIVLLGAFFIGTALSTVTSTSGFSEPLAALLPIALIELAVRWRRRLIRQPGDKLGLQLMDMARIGLLYGLLMEGFKVL